MPTPAIPGPRKLTEKDVSLLNLNHALTAPLRTAARVVGLYEPEFTHKRKKIRNPLHATEMRVQFSLTPHGNLILSAVSDTGAKTELFASFHWQQESS